jgi:hypothetical protein
MAEDPDLERKLEAMFHSAMPRRGFEEDLWQKIGGRLPWHQRFRRRFQPVVRYAPALATILIVSLGITWLAASHGGGLTSGGSTTSAGAPAMGGGEKSAWGPAFGVLPRLASGAQPSFAAPQVTAGNADTTAGLSFGGTLPSLPTELPVYRYDEPTADDRARSAAALQAQSGLSIAVTPSDAARGLEPQFNFKAPAPSGSQGSIADRANLFLAAHNLLPRFAFQLSPAASGSEVIYGRVFDGPAGPVRQVRPDASVAGLTVGIAGAGVSAQGPLDLPLSIAPYPARSASEALSAANVHQVSVGADLDHAELVYVLVISGGHGYYEPELLLTGAGRSVLAPVVAQAWLHA